MSLDFARGDRFAVLGFLRQDRDRVVSFVLERAGDEFAVVEQDLVAAVEPLDLVGDGGELFRLAAVDDVGMNRALQRLVRGHADDVELVDFPEFAGLGEGGARHAADLVVQLEEVLQRDRGERLRFLLDRDAFLGLDGLVQAVAPMAARHEAAGELVDDHHLAVLDDVVHVALVEVMGLERVVDQVRPLHVAGRVEAFDAGQPLGLANAFVGEVGGVLFLLDFEVDVLLELAGDLVGTRVLRDIIFGRAGDDERRAGFVDEDVVDFVDDREVERALRLLLVLRIMLIVAAGGDPHVVAEIVEAEFVVRAVGDVAGVRLLALVGFHAALNRADGEAEAGVERAHPFHVAAGQVVVHRDDVDRATGLAF